MTEFWEQLEVFEDEASAETMAGRLRMEGVPTEIEASSPFPGLNEGFRVMVPKHLAHRARWVLAAIDTTESELTYLATGELPGEDEPG